MKTKAMYFILISLIIFIANIATSAQEDRCRDFMLTDGSEQLVDLGIDSTGNWWVLTAPFSFKYRITISDVEYDVLDSLTLPVFSHDGKNWAFFGYDVGSWKLFTRYEVIEFGSVTPGSIIFSTITNLLVYSVYRGDIEYVNINGKEIQIMHRSGNLYISPWGDRFAFTALRGMSHVVNINGRDSDFFDDIIPAGFKENGEFVYAGRRGNGWRIYYNETEISTEFKDVLEIAVNPTGRTVGALVLGFSSKYQGVMFSDEYREPLYGMMYDKVWGLAVHPNLALISYGATFNLANYVVFSTTEYNGGLSPGTPRFTHDGDVLYFIGCDMECFVNVNGRKYVIYGGLDPSYPIALDTEGKAIAYGTSAHLSMVYLETGNTHAGIMVDYATRAIYNRNTNRFESLGVINNRVYLLTCKP
ncbi:MAG: hypothetical protein KGZ71_00055 [Desulfobulbaceae bacterium]|nr:hypothetical protein [Desulfobulbaceae bacterium]